MEARAKIEEDLFTRVPLSKTERRRAKATTRSMNSLANVGDFGDDVADLVARCRRHTDLPLGVGFGISDRSDMDYLRGHADLAIVGTAALRAWEQGGAEQLSEFFSELLAD